MKPGTDLIVQRVESATLLLAQAKDAKDAKRVADLGRAAEIYAQRQKLSEEAIANATAIKIDAMTLMGEFLRTAPKAIGTAGQGRPKIGGSRKEPPKNIEEIASLSSAGISKKESSNGQFLARLKEQEPALHDSVRNGTISVQTAKQKMKEPEPPRRFPLSDAFHHWLELTQGHIRTAQIIHGSLKIMFSNKTWDRRRNREFLERFNRLLKTLHQVQKELNDEIDDKTTKSDP
jgi:hypothetical protein